MRADAGKLSGFTEMVVQTMPGSGHGPQDEEPLTYLLASLVVEALQGLVELKHLTVEFDPILREGKLEKPMKEFNQHGRKGAGNLARGIDQLGSERATGRGYHARIAFMQLDDVAYSGLTMG